METNSFTPTFGSALRENILVLIGLIVGVPVLMLARSAAHPGMTITWAVMSGLIGGTVLFLIYTIRFFLRVPKEVVISEDELLLRWRKGPVTSVPWVNVRRAVFRARWGYRWKFYLDGSAPTLWGDGFSATTWERMSDLIEAQFSARNIPIEKYDAYGKRVA